MSDLINLLSSIRGDFISDYIGMVDSTDVIFLHNMTKYVQVKLDSVNAMLRREKETIREYKHKLDDSQQDVVRRLILNYKFLLQISDLRTSSK